MSASTSRAPIVFVTGNKNKLKEVQEILAGSGDLQITNHNVDGEWADEVISPLSASLWPILDKSQVTVLSNVQLGFQQLLLAFCSTALSYLAELVFSSRNPRGLLKRSPLPSVDMRLKRQVAHRRTVQCRRGVAECTTDPTDSLGPLA